MGAAAASALEQFEVGMDDDLNTPRAAAGLFALVKAAEKVYTPPSPHDHTFYTPCGGGGGGGAAAFLKHLKF